MSAPDRQTTTLSAVGLGALLDDLGDPSTPRAAGAACALTGAGAAALVAMVAAASGAQWPEAAGAAAQATALRTRLTGLADANAVAFAHARELLDQARGASQGGNAWRLSGALAAAADVPVRVAEAAADVALLALEAAREGDADRRADAAVAAALAAGAVDGAHRLVAANLGVRADDEPLSRAHAAAAAARAAAREAAAL